MPDPEGSPEFEPDEVLIRGIQKSRLAWDHELRDVVVKLEHYMLRPTDTDGLSVDRIAYTDYQSASQSGRFKCWTKITVAEVEAIGLGVAAKEGSISGACITGLPGPEDPDSQVEWADKLRASFTWDRRPSNDLVKEIQAKASQR